MRKALDEPDPSLVPNPVDIVVAEHVSCENGYANAGVHNTFMCKDFDLYSITPHRKLGSNVGIGNDIWGWSRDGRDFALVGQMDGTAFAELNDNGTVVYLGRLPTQSEDSLWRDIKVIGDFAYIGSEAPDHGIQVFDLKKLLDKSLQEEPKNFSITSDLTSHFDGLPAGSSHNIVAHEEKNLIVAVGSLPRTDHCGAGLIFVDVTDPANPVSKGCAGEDGYVHDAQCLTYHGPDKRYEGKDICYGYNENTLTIYDITEPEHSTIISVTYYFGVTYSHQGWVIDEKDQRYLLLDDELDEMWERGWAVNQHTTTYIWDIQDLEHPILTGKYQSPVKAIDHNLYVKDGWAYESNYRSGLRVVDVSSVYDNPTGTDFTEVGFFDVYPEDDDIGGEAKFGGSWSVYPYFESGFVIVNSMDRGLFVVKYKKA
ncbi:hypothetical protein BT69DRAFT_1214249 [Atractiella rhizophila]|nr:hypothetical protein BT69DRAFT_1214249 [Atractiella rhizophila]